MSFTYDLTYIRVTSMTDGAGTTTYSYNPATGAVTTGAGKLHSVVTPIAGGTATVAYAYDKLGRVTGRTIDGASGVNTAFDALGRVTNVTNPLGAFGYAYVDQTSRLDTVTYPNGQKTKYGYFDNIGDQRLKEINNYVTGIKHKRGSC